MHHCLVLCGYLHTPLCQHSPARWHLYLYRYFNSGNKFVADQYWSEAGAKGRSDCISVGKEYYYCFLFVYSAAYWRLFGRLLYSTSFKYYGPMERPAFKQGFQTGSITRMELFICYRGHTGIYFP